MDELLKEVTLYVRALRQKAERELQPTLPLATVTATVTPNVPIEEPKPERKRKAKAEAPAPAPAADPLLQSEAPRAATPAPTPSADPAEARKALEEAARAYIRRFKTQADGLSAARKILTNAGYQGLNSVPVDKCAGVIAAFEAEIRRADTPVGAAA